MGGLGGFFPPLLLGFFRDQFGYVWPGFALLAAAAALWVLNARVFLPASARRAGRRRRSRNAVAAPASCAPARGRRWPPRFS
jgi:nitrate/nitrite transporter NarK